VTNRSLTGVIAVWLALLGAGGYAAFRYETTAGVDATSGPRWPQASRLARAADGATVVMFVHPECGCTAASLAELAAIVDDAAPARVLIVFVGGPAAALPTSANWRAAGRIPGAIRVADPGGPTGEARRFGARTSGHVAVYDRHGALVFSGGITGSRGHVGDNVGRRAAIDALRGAPAPALHAVFGCSLEDAS
jgi:hypothetical protein